MIAFVVILEDEFPICLYIIWDASRRLENRQVPTFELVQQRLERMLKGFGGFGKIEEDEALPHMQIDCMQRILILIAIRHILHQRHADQFAVQGIGPRMIRTLDGFAEFPFCFLAHMRAAVTANVVESADFPVLISQDNNAFTISVENEVITRARNTTDMSGTKPASSKNLPDFSGKDLK